MVRIGPVASRALVAAVLALACTYGMGATQRLGPVYPIAEQDMLEELQAKLEAMKKDGRLQDIQNQAIARAKRSIDSPSALGLPRAFSSRSWHVDPTYTVPEDLTDQEGRVFARAGDKVNPFQRGVRLSKPLLFIDMADEWQSQHLAEFLQRWPGAKVILTGGRWRDTARSIGRAVYFDQGGSLTRQFGIVAVPALVEQDQLMLRVTEIVQ